MTDAATPETATASESLDLHGAARAIERLLRREPTSATAVVGIGRDSPGAQEHEGEEGSEAAEPSAEDSEAEDSEDRERQTADPDEPHHTVKVDGESLDVPLSELIKGYQRGADYTRKTMRLADERRDAETLRERLDGELTSAQREREYYAERLAGTIPALRQQLAQFEGLDWARLAAENPAVYARAQPMHAALVGQLQQAEAEQMQLQQHAQQRHLQQAHAHQQHLTEQKQALVARVPELADAANGRRETAALARYLSEAGYAPEEMARLVDHRDFILARKAMLYDRLAGSREQVKERLAALPRVQQPGTARDHRRGAGERRAAMMRRLQRTGSTEDAARLIEDLL